MVGRTRGAAAPTLAIFLVPVALSGAGFGCAEQGQIPFVQPPGCPTARPGCGDRCVDRALGETCDDGNRLPGDGCDRDCQRETPADADTTPHDDAAGADADADLPAEAEAEAGADADDATPPRDDGGGTDTGTCDELPCGLRPNCGCPAGQKCTADEDRLPLLLLIRECGTAGTRDSSQLCTTDAECATGTVCLALFTQAGGTDKMCAEFCNVEADCTAPGSVCVSLTELISGTGTCTHSCSPITGTGCPSGTSCQVMTLGTTGQILTDCTADTGSAAPHSVCSSGAECRLGVFCADTTGDGMGDECIQWCLYPGGTCSGGDTCRQFTDATLTPMPLIIDGTEYGFCYGA
jgi:cysteine-rich repeat protein